LSTTRIVATAFLLLIAATSFAKPPFLKVFVTTYKIKPTSALGKASCLACHQPPSPPRRNPYGLAVQSAMEAAHVRMLTPEILKSVEKKDSDNDGFSNLEEIKADKMPGDPKSKPEKPKKKTKAKRKSALNDMGYGFVGAGLVSVGLLGLAVRTSRRR
jgi:hypothetical protein